MQEYNGYDYGSISNTGYIEKDNISLSNNYISSNKMEKILEQINNSVREKDTTILNNSKEYTDSVCDALQDNIKIKIANVAAGMQTYTKECCGEIYDIIDEKLKSNNHATDERINIIADKSNHQVEQCLGIMTDMEEANGLQNQRVTRIANNLDKRSIIFGGTLIATLLALITSTIILGTKVNTLEHQVSVYETQIISEENTND